MLSFLPDIKFTVPEILSLLGVAQCIYILVYLSFRAGQASRAILPFLYFSVLAISFFADLAERFLGGALPYYKILQYTLWFSSVPLAVLVIIQIARITHVPSAKYVIILPIPLYALLAAYGFNGFLFGCGRDQEVCQGFTSWFVIFSMGLCGLSLLAVWLQRGLLVSLSAQKFGKERYWLILSVIVINIIFLITMFGYFVPDVSDTDLKIIRTILGLSLIYLVTTSLFRIYPQSIRIREPNNLSEDRLNDDELDIAFKVERLIAFEKVYHEPKYGRSDLARELKVAESVLSRIINVHFGKSLPQIFNEKRVEAAKALLVDTDVNVSIIAQEVGFNSLASFNRVFKDVAGLSPSDYRKNKSV